MKRTFAAAVVSLVNLLAVTSACTGPAGASDGDGATERTRVFPNPQDAFPLPARPNAERYRELAEDLLKAADGEDAIAEWADRFVAGIGVDERGAAKIEAFARQRLRERATLSEAQLVIARSHGFASWPKLVAALDRLAHGGAAAFEAAADAIVNGDEAGLRALLAQSDGLARATSERTHGATLLHYTSANGVEGYRQRSPKNIVAVATLLLDAGADVDAEADVYGGGCTTLGLVATSTPPRQAGVQLPLLALLIERGAMIEKPRIGGNGQGAVMACLHNGCPEAAAYLASRGATLSAEGAAGVGRLDVVARATFGDGEREAALRHATVYGHDDIVTWLLDHGADAANSAGRQGQTAAHFAAMAGRASILKLLIARGAPLEAKNEYGGTVLGQALWSAAHGGNVDVYEPIVAALIDAGAVVPPTHVPVNARIDALLTRHGSVADADRHWAGEEPRRRVNPLRPRSPV